MAVRSGVGDGRARETDLECLPTRRRLIPTDFLERVSDRFSSLSFRRAENEIHMGTCVRQWLLVFTATLRLRYLVSLPSNFH
jgi:hypothetical protein